MRGYKTHNVCHKYQKIWIFLWKSDISLHEKQGDTQIPLVTTKSKITIFSVKVKVKKVIDLLVIWKCFISWVRMPKLSLYLLEFESYCNSKRKFWNVSEMSQSRSQDLIRYVPSCTNECIGPTPPSILGSWFFNMSFTHSLTQYACTLSSPSNLKYIDQCSNCIPETESQK